eukprot:scaffold86076_cov32-Prasinocladus_malaysianus.AAC.1
MVGQNLPVQPPPSPFVGNLPLLTAKGALGPSVKKILEDYDYEVVRLVIGPQTMYVHCDPEIAERVTTDTECFGKITHLAKRGPFYSTRKLVGKALFTASDAEEEWGIAHRILISAFSFRGMKPVVPIAVEATRNTINTLSKLRHDEPVEIGSLMTGITFDGAPLCRARPNM